MDWEDVVWFSNITFELSQTTQRGAMNSPVTFSYVCLESRPEYGRVIFNQS